MLMEQIGTYYDKTEKKIAESEERMKQHFDVVAENLHYDMVGVHKDKIQNHEDRIKRLEDHTGVLAA